MRRFVLIVLCLWIAVGQSRQGRAGESTQIQPASNSSTNPNPTSLNSELDAPRLVTRTPMTLTPEVIETLAGGEESWASPENVGGSLRTILALSVVSLAPAILLMSTCYVRIIVVLTLLRQAIGLQTLPPTQVLTSVSLFMTLLVMTPVWSRVYQDAIVPYRDPAVEMSVSEAYEAGALPIRQFMSRQIAAAGNYADVSLFFRHAFPDQPLPKSFGDVPIQALLPAFVISELKIAFLMGFSIYLPFLVVDLVVASVTMSMGMFMLPPAMVSLPLKLLLFAMVNGWHLVVGMLLTSFGAEPSPGVSHPSADATASVLHSVSMFVGG